MNSESVRHSSIRKEHHNGLFIDLDRKRPDSRTMMTPLPQFRLFCPKSTVEIQRVAGLVWMLLNRPDGMRLLSR
jgi:hypothetical protein